MEGERTLHSEQIDKYELRSLSHFVATYLNDVRLLDKSIFFFTFCMRVSNNYRAIRLTFPCLLEVQSGSHELLHLIISIICPKAQTRILF